MASSASDTSGIRVSRSQALFASWVSDVLVYIVVLGLFVEYVPSVITESFSISIFTAVVLKVLIDAIARLEHRVSGWFKRREGSGWRVLGMVTIFSILFSPSSSSSRSSTSFSVTASCWEGSSGSLCSC